MRKYNGVIFDLDGVLVHTDEFHYLAWKALADENGIYFDRKINERLRGVSREKSLEIILEKSNENFSKEEKQILCDKKNNYYRDYLMKMTKNDIDDEVINTLNSLKQSQIKLAVGSSSKNAKLILVKTELIDYFDAISDGENIVNSKPSPEVFEKACEYIRLTPKDCLIVEDAFSGIDAAINGGFDSAGIGAAAKYEKTTYKIERISDLISIVSGKK